MESSSSKAYHSSSVPQPIQKVEDITKNPNGNGTLKHNDDLFAPIPLPFDFRNHLRLPIVLIILSPLVLNFLSFRNCIFAFIGLCSVPEIVRLRYPRFMEVNIIDDLRIEAGACLSILASTTALLLETHHSGISAAVRFHPEFYNRPLTRLLRTYLFVEMIYNGTSEEKEKTASWLRWTHRHMHGSITESMQKEFNIPEGIKTYGYINELKAWVMATLTWSTIAFQSRFGRPLSKRALDTIVLENTCAALRLGIPEKLLAKDYESFLILFNSQLDALSTGNSLTRSIVKEVEHAAINSKMHWITKIWIRLALMVGYDLLPARVREAYDLQILRPWWSRFILKAVMASLWLVYPILMWLPLRGVICLMLVLEPQLRPIFKTSLNTLHSMDVLSDEPQYAKDAAYFEKTSLAPSYLTWLGSGKDGQPFLQRVLVEVLRTQLRSSCQAQASSTWFYRFGLWILLPLHLAALFLDALHRSVLLTISQWRTQIKESTIYKDGNAKVPRHVGFVMDGNRRYARNMGRPVIVGHQHGAQTAGNVLEWWLRFISSTSSSSGTVAEDENLKYLTVWAFSSENLKRSTEEVDGLFRLMSAEFRSLALTSIVHLFQVRVRVIGNLEGYPKELRSAISFLENATRMYNRLHLQIAMGYGGRDEIVRSVRAVLAQGGEITEESIGRNTFCARSGIPPVDMIVRTSERRTSGFFLWDTQAAELYFIDKLWPQLTEGDFLDAVASYSRREMRGGK